MRSAEIGADPETGEELEKILIELPLDHWSGNGGERVWAKRLGNERYEIRNTPWYAYDTNWGDVVVCERPIFSGPSDRLEARKRVRSPHTARVVRRECRIDGP